MKKLSAENFARARDYVFSSARPLEQALFQFYFEQGAPTAVWQKLAGYQNADGGFGHALEPDVRTPSSSALATGIALRLLAETGAPRDHALVREAVAYLQKTLDPQTLTWRVVPLDTHDHPHAPWWHDQDGSLATTFDDYQIIPRAELVAYLYHFSDPAPASWLVEVKGAAVLALEHIPMGGGGGDDIVYALRLAQERKLKKADQDRLLQRVREVAVASVVRDPVQWETYSIPPLKLAPSPASPVADLFPDDIQRHLDYLIDTQTAVGFWDTTWTWGDFFPDAWPQAREEWRGELTLQHLLTLRAYDRIILL